MDGLKVALISREMIVGTMWQHVKDMMEWKAIMDM